MLTKQLKNTTLLKCSNYINGKWVDSKNKFTITSPSTGEFITDVSSGSIADAVNAVDSAEKALVHWREKTAKQRSKLLKNWYELILSNAGDLAIILTLEQGKPLEEANGEVLYGANYVEWFAEEAKRIYGDTISPPSNDKRLVVIKQGVGVVSAITPWNFPCAMILRKAAPALAAGCTFVVKPSEITPLSALALAVLADEAGIPAGVFNVIASNQSKLIGEVLTTDPRIRKFTFTGSTQVGKILIKQCADTVKKTSMELGGNAPFIVFDDADINLAVEGAVASKFRNAGQTCVCTNRIFVQDGIYDEFIDKFKLKTSTLRIGDGFSVNVDLGPLVTAKAVDEVHEKVIDSVLEGAKIELGGEILKLGECFYPPTILSNVTPQMTISKEEIFGPVAPVMRFTTEEEVVCLANDTDVGLASYIYTNNVGRAWRVSENLEYGMVGVNESLISNEMAPFGGIKQSGFGREGSKYGLEDYLEIKYICFGSI